MTRSKQYLDTVNFAKEESNGAGDNNSAGTDFGSGKNALLEGFAWLAVFFMSTTPLLAAEPDDGAQPILPPRNRIYLSSATVAGYNPLAMETQNRLMYSRRLSDRQSVLFRDTFVALGPSLKLAPTNMKAGWLLDFQPLAVFEVLFGYEFVDYFGILGYLQSYSNPRADFSDSARSDTKNNAYSTTGHHLFVEPMLQMKVRNIAVRTKFAFEYWNMDLKDGDKYFYGGTDTLLPVKHWVWSNDTDLVYMSGRLMVGGRFSGVFPDNDENSHMRLGPLIAWSFNTDDHTRFNKPTVIGILGWYLKHPNRVGGAPYVLVRYSFSSDLL